MMSCGAILSKNVRPPFQKRAIDLVRRRGYPYSQIFSNVEKNIETIQICNFSIPSRFPQISCIREFHRGSLMLCSKSERNRSLKIDLKDVFDEKEIGDVDIFDKHRLQLEKTFPHKEQPIQPDHLSNRERFSVRDIERMYPNPKGKLNDIYQIVCHEMKNKNALITTFTSTKNSGKKMQNWTCTMKIQWPEEMTFSATANNKINSGNAAATKCLLYLENNRKLTPTKRPILYSSSDINEILNRPVRLQIDERGLIEAKNIIEKYNDEVKEIIERFEMKNLKNSINKVEIDSNNGGNRAQFQDGAIIDPVGKSNPFNRNPDKIEGRNEILKKRFEHRIESESRSRLVNHAPLPITDYREEIIQAIENNQVIVIKGDTGCGKTTQVPQYIMDHFASQGNATNCNIIVSQPRRISAISLAERIADERREQIGDVVGYQVRLNQNLPNTPAGILFCTAGILLRKLQFNPDLEGCSHVIIDEAHERTIDIDMLLALLKRAVVNNKNLKVIIMSATINAELFQNFFNCGVIQVPGRTFPVTMNFMEDIDKLGLRIPNNHNNNMMMMNDELVGEIVGPSVDIDKISELILWINRNSGPGAILCFLPGWSEIMKVKKYLEEVGFQGVNSRAMIVPVHSRMSHHDQKKIFQIPPPEVRKIVLATDIAETGITVTDVAYVVDSCTHRQVRWHEKRGLSSIDNHWASQANINQRKGRAGRVKPGVSYHLISREMFENLEPFPIPEVKRSSLEKTVLDAKTYSSEKALKFLSSLPEPPGESVIRYAVKDLIKLGALDMDENLTPLGERIAFLTVNPNLAKALVYSSVFQCLSPMVTITSAMSSDNDLFVGQMHNKEAIRRTKQKYHPTSDHNSIVWLFREWDGHNKNDLYEARDFCMRSRVYPERMYTLSKIRELNINHLIHAKMVDSLEESEELEGKFNQYNELDELVRGVLLAGLDHIMCHRNFDMRKGMLRQGTQTFILEDGNRATITPDSVNFKRKTWPSPFLTYVMRTHSEERRTSLIRETSVISPLTTFLFSQGKFTGYIKNKNDTYKNDIGSENNEEKYGISIGNLRDQEEIYLEVQGRKHIKLICNKETAEVMMKFRDIMWTIVRYIVANHGKVSTDEKLDYDQVEIYKESLLKVLGHMLSVASDNIDDPKDKFERTRTDDYSKFSGEDD